ncbi:MAG: cell division protein ZapA, partial [Betaproteobacteria bacterium]|nr:cell division protein ZapA [Betaproteobacteria bacterium]
MSADQKRADGVKTLDITLLGRSYRVACSDEERDALLKAVAYLEGKMNDIK